VFKGLKVNKTGLLCHIIQSPTLLQKSDRQFCVCDNILSCMQECIRLTRVGKAQSFDGENELFNVEFCEVIVCEIEQHFEYRIPEYNKFSCSPF